MVSLCGAGHLAPVLGQLRSPPRPVRALDHAVS